MRNILIIIGLFIGGIILGQNKQINNPYSGVDFTNYYKSNLHSHTIESDGGDSVSEFITRFQDADYDILAITDHDSYETAPDPQYPGVGSTWPWTKFISETPSVIYKNNTVEMAALYPDINSGDSLLAIRGNELTPCGVQNHMGSWFTDLGYATCPADGWNTFLTDIEANEGYAIIYHPGRDTATVPWYNEWLTDYRNIILGIEVFNFGNHDPVQSSPVVWDSLNMTRDYDDLLWGFSNPDFHNSYPFRNYNYHFMDSLSFTDFKSGVLQGATTFSYESVCGTGITKVPRLTGVTIADSLIIITTTTVDSIVWRDNARNIISYNDTLNVNDYETNFVRAELYQTYETAGETVVGTTFTQPFGVSVSQTYYVVPRYKSATSGGKFMFNAEGGLMYIKE